MPGKEIEDIREEAEWMEEKHPQDWTEIRRTTQKRPWNPQCWPGVGKKFKCVTEGGLR